MADSKSNQKDLNRLVEGGAEVLHGYKEGSYESVDEVDGTRYVFFPYRDLEEGIETISAQKIDDILEKDQRFPVMRDLCMSVDKANRENRGGSNFLIARIEEGNIKNMGYAIENHAIIGLWSYEDFPQR